MTTQLHSYRFTFVAIVQLDVQHIDAHLLKDLQSPRQSAHLVETEQLKWPWNV